MMPAGSASTPPGGTPPAADAQLVKARKVAAAVGLVAGAFGSMLGVGGGVLIAPAIANTCKWVGHMRPYEAMAHGMA